MSERPTPGAPPPSPLRAASAALDHTWRTLKTRPRASRWGRLLAVTFLAHMGILTLASLPFYALPVQDQIIEWQGELEAAAQSNITDPHGARDKLQAFFSEKGSSIREWMATEGRLPAVAAAVIPLTLILMCWGLLAMWIDCRYQPPLVDAAARGDVGVEVSWEEYRLEGNSLFWWRLGYVILFGLAGPLAVAIGIGVPVAWMIRHREILPAWLVWSSGAGTLALCTVLLLFSVVDAITIDLLVPLQARLRISTGAAWKLFLAFARRHSGPTALYVGARIGLGILVAMSAGFVIQMGWGLPSMILDLLRQALPTGFFRAAAGMTLGAVGILVTTALQAPFRIFLRTYALCYLDMYGEPFGFLAKPPVTE